MSRDSARCAAHLDVTLIDQSSVIDGLTEIAVTRLVAFVLSEESQHGNWTVSVVLSDDASLRALHREFMGLDAETDVMTFPLTGARGDDVGEPGGNPGGDIVVSVERAAAQALDYGLTTVEEVRFLIVHGLLHLCGWTDSLPEEQTRMLERQQILLQTFDRISASEP